MSALSITARCELVGYLVAAFCPEDRSAPAFVLKFTELLEGLRASWSRATDLERTLIAAAHIEATLALRPIAGEPPWGPGTITVAQMRRALEKTAAS